MAHKYKIYAISDIDNISDMAHNYAKGGVMTDIARSAVQLGSLVRRARKKNGLSQTDLGNTTGLRQETISLIETGNPATRLDTILNVLAALDLELRVVQRTSSDAHDIEDVF